MKMFNFNCPRCGKFFYGDNTLIELKAPIHCPGCDKYYQYEEYVKVFEGTKDTTLARLNKPLTEENMLDIIYIPKKQPVK
ncbi:MAG TPA: hypothetical protein DCZ10_18230, partial [Pelotomaculum sp.]|nr:hypothetical protein [Pelotomaculum sp.]